MTDAAKKKVLTIKLEPGTDLVGTVKFVSFYPEKVVDGEKYSAQWGLTGTFNGQEGRVYVATYMLTTDLTTYVQQDGQWTDGNPRWKWVGKGTFRLHPYVKDKRHYVTVGPADAPVAGSNAGPIAVPSHVPTPDPDVRWSELERSYQKAVGIAVASWPSGNFTAEALVAAAATVFIEANKRGLTVPAKESSFAGMPGPLAEAEEPPPWMDGR